MTVRTFRVALVIAFALCAWQVLSAGFLRRFSLDEFMFAHAGWEVARGALPYRDFFVAHHPLSFALFSWPFFFGNDPTQILWLRGTMVVSLLLTATAAWVIGRRHSSAAAWLAPLLLLSTPALVEYGTEVRAEGVAWALLFGALAVLYLHRVRPGWRGFLAGLLLALAVVTNQKVFVWGIGFVVAFAVDLRARARGRPLILGHLGTFLLGAVIGILPFLLWIAVTGVGPELFDNAYVWALAQQQQRRPLNLIGFKSLGAFVAFSWWLVPLAALSLWRIARAGPVSTRADLLLVMTLLATTVYVVTARAPYEYYLLPAASLWALFAARGLADAWVILGETRARARLGLITLVALLGLGAHAHLAREIARDNRDQLESLATIAQLTHDGDCVYDNSGFAVTRPSAHWYFVTDAHLRSTIGPRLAAEIPAAILARQCPVFVTDRRHAELPKELLAFLTESFQPYDDRLRLWGRRITPGKTRFTAVADGTYFVHPENRAEACAVAIDGQKLQGAEQELGRGEHLVDSSCELPTEELWLLWLPRDGVRWSPRLPDAG